VCLDLGENITEVVLRWRPLFNKSQKGGKEGKHKYRCRPLLSQILNFGASEDPGVNMS
jgi:hypothetical protein